MIFGRHSRAHQIDWLALLIEARSDQYDVKNQSASAKELWDDVRRAFRGLKFQIPDPGHVLGLLGREYRDREPDLAAAVIAFYFKSR